MDLKIEKSTKKGTFRMAKQPLNSAHVYMEIPVESSR
jgi:hypothetical protein